MSSVNRSSTVPPLLSSSLPRSDSFIRPRQPSLDVDRDILSTRGQRLGGLIRRRSLSIQSTDGLDETDRLEESFSQGRGERPLAFERARRLIGDNRPIYHWYEAFTSILIGQLTGCCRQRYYQDPTMLKKMPKPMYVPIVP